MNRQLKDNRNTDFEIKFPESLEILQKLHFKSISIVNPSKSDVGPYIYNTMLVDKNQNQKESLFDIYKAIRLGESPSSLEVAKNYFDNLLTKSHFEI